MKKILILLAIGISIFIYKEDNTIIIPDSSIRFRIISNSNSIEDQKIKMGLEKHLERYLYNIVKESKSANGAYSNIKAKEENINKEIISYFNKNNMKVDYKLSIGNNVFPKKKYKGVEYKSGSYQSIVVKLGKAQGINWWCVIYPPLCLIDDKDNTEYTTLAQEIINKYNM